MLNVKNFLKSTTLTLTSKRHEHDDVWSYSFKPSTPIEHIAGQHALFFLPGIVLPKSFSIASAPKDDEIMIGTHVRAGSVYKQTLHALEIGSEIKMRGPLLNFTLDDGVQDVVMLAQGIGITPFRSLLRDIYAERFLIKTSLVHVAKSAHTYKKETEKLANHSVYPVSSGEFQAAVNDIAPKHQRATYYVSGTPKFNNATIKQLKYLGIPRNHIKTDFFLGYW